MNSSALKQLMLTRPPLPFGMCHQYIRTNLIRPIACVLLQSFTHTNDSVCLLSCLFCKSVAICGTIHFNCVHDLDHMQMLSVLGLLVKILSAHDNTHTHTHELEWYRVSKLLLK